MNYQGRFETFKESTKYMFQPDLQDVLFVFFGLIASVFVLIVLPYFVSKYIKGGTAKRGFEIVGKSMGLDNREINLLYKCAKDLDDPNKLFHSKYAFEKCAGKLVKMDSENIPIVVSARKKLRFDHLPWFLPLSTTKDIDLYQTGFISYKEKSYSSALWETTEQDLHIAVLDRMEDIPKVGERIKFSFFREDDGRYNFTEEIIDTYFDGNRVVLVLPHAEKLSRMPLREFIRWKISVPARVFFFKRAVSLEELQSMEEIPKEDFLQGTVKDISVGGLKVCVKGSVEVKEGESLLVEFEWKNFNFGRILSEVRNVKSSAEGTCVGVKFLNLKEEHEETITKFILEEQRETLKAYKIGK